MIVPNNTPNFEFTNQIGSLLHFRYRCEPFETNELVLNPNKWHPFSSVDLWIEHIAEKHSQYKAHINRMGIYIYQGKQQEALTQFNHCWNIAQEMRLLAEMLIAVGNSRNQYIPKFIQDMVIGE